LRENIDDRARMLAEFIIENNTTIRAAAKHFGTSKSTVHKDITERLEKSDKLLYTKVRQILDLNKAERHMRGGIATRNKYKAKSKTDL